MKKLFTLAVLAATALSASAVDVPWESAIVDATKSDYTQSFVDGWTPYDNNGSESTRKGLWTNVQVYRAAAVYMYASARAGDDYLTTPGLELKTGVTYTVSYDVYTGGWGDEKLEILLCLGNDKDALLSPVKTIKALETIPKGTSWKTVSFDFTVDADQTYYISYHCCSDSDQEMLGLSNFKIDGAGGSGPVEKQPAGLSFDSEAYDYTFSDTYYEVPALNNPNSLSGIKWSSSDPAIASFGTSGNITLRKAGSATNPVSVEITASFEGNELFEAGEAKYTLNIYKGKGVMSFDKDAVEITIGEDLPEVALTKPFDRIIPKWNSSDTNVATVSGNGEVSVVGVGTTTITASVTSTDLWDVAPASYTVTVKEKAPFVVEPIAAGCHEFNTMEDPVAGTPDEVTGWVNYTWTVSGRSSNETYEVDLQLEGYDYVAYALRPEAGAEVNAPVRRASADIAYDATADNLKEQYSDLQEVKLENGVARISLPVYNYGNEVKEVVPSTYVLFPGKAAAEGETGTYNTSATHTLVSAMNYDSTTGVAGIEADEAEAEYYNLQGVRVANPEKGIYVRVQNGKASKVIL